MFLTKDQNAINNFIGLWNIGQSLLDMRSTELAAAFLLLQAKKHSFNMRQQNLENAMPDLLPFEYIEVDAMPDLLPFEYIEVAAVPDEDQQVADGPFDMTQILNTTLDIADTVDIRYYMRTHDIEFNTLKPVKTQYLRIGGTRLRPNTLFVQAGTFVTIDEVKECTDDLKARGIDKGM